MYNEASLNPGVNHGLHYPIATNYEYICPAFEAPANWVEHRMFFGQEIQYSGILDESMAYIYYTPSNGYAQSAYNPYNPFVAAYIPMAVQSRPDIITNRSTDPFIRNDAFVNRTDGGRALKQKLSSESPSFSQTPFWDASIKDQSKGSSGVQPRNSTRASLNKFRPKVLNGRALHNAETRNDALIEQNPVPRIHRLKGQSVVKAYMTKTGDSDLQGNTMIYVDQYNKGDFPTDYIYAKFFVIKSFSEDDVHKSIKYKVWSSTPNGNRRLNAAFQDAQKIAGGDSRGCPIFLFFSVNASGQFCGVAEMIGPVDFEKDMEFWQKDMWSGSFPVKWHIIKDVRNLDLRHIMLENNENKPVTHSRDTQEIHYKEGIEMLKIFKKYNVKTCLLDDFTFYENREKIRQEERARLIFKSYENPYLVPPRKLAPIPDPCGQDEKVVQRNESDLKEYVSSNVGSVDGTPNMDIELKIGSLTINLKE